MKYLILILVMFFVACSEGDFIDEQHENLGCSIEEVVVCKDDTCHCELDCMYQFGKYKYVKEHVYLPLRVTDKAKNYCNYSKAD